MTWKKLERDGKVAVLVSPGYGAGWSTWADDGIRERMLFDSELAEAVLAGDLARAAQIAKGFEKYVYTGGTHGLTVEWVPKGSAVRVDEYDGHESLIVGTPDYFTA